ncbi:MAG: hypothetical protein KDJ29_18255, partial [Hyphomicrobiales bacterium]|nr:hypothetical protein [Hyphomicrobiales bacterium]
MTLAHSTNQAATNQAATNQASTNQDATDLDSPRNTAHQTGLRTLELERQGIAALEAELAIGGPEGLASRFQQAVELILSRQGRVIVSGMGKSGHIA